MASFQNGTNKMVTCPFDASHRMLQSRFQMHIVKCKQNHVDKDIATCPFNATHQILRSLLSDHLTKCPERVVLDKKLMAQNDPDETFKGRTAVPSYHYPVPECSEVWDLSDMPSSGDIPKPTITADRLLGDLGLMKKAERRKVYQSLHQLQREPAETSVKEVVRKPRAAEEVYRQPKQTFVESIKDRGIQTPMPGLGRGRVDSRIAANIFNSANDEDVPEHLMRQPQSAKEVIAGLNNLGLGRGRPATYEEHFPAL